MLDFLLMLPYVVLAGMIIVFKKYMTGQVCRNQTRTDGKTVIITGANTGIGKATARELVRRGSRVILACRNTVLGHTAARDLVDEFQCPDRVSVYHLDLASMDSIRTFVRKFKANESRLDILINNAGVMWCPYSLTQDGFEMQIGVNHLGHFLLTNLLLDELRAAPQGRVITLTSIAHFYAQMKNNDLHSKLSYSPSDAYAQSKLANVLFTRELAKRVKGTRITTYAVHPGVVRTEIGRYMDILNTPIIKYFFFPLLQPIIWLLTRNTTQGAQTSVHCATSEELRETTGGYYSDCEEQVAGKAAQDDHTAAWLWETSLDLCGLRASKLDIPAPVPIRGEELLGTSRAN